MRPYTHELHVITSGYSQPQIKIELIAAVDLPFAVNSEARRQNTMKFLAIIFGLLLCWRITKSDFYYNLHGDSMSSLAWAENGRVNSTLARRNSGSRDTHTWKAQ